MQLHFATKWQTKHKHLQNALHTSSHHSISFKFPVSLPPHLEVGRSWKIKMPRWYKPEYHARDLKNFIEVTARSTEQIYNCLDMFGASGRVAQTWVDAGFSAIGFDVKIDGGHDITSEDGVKTLLKMALQFLGD